MDTTGCIKTSISINGLLSSYLDALTDVCKVGIQLAGKFNELLHTTDYTAYRCHGGGGDPASHSPTALSSSPIDAQNLTQLVAFYTHLLTKVAPLWQTLHNSTSTYNVASGVDSKDVRSEKNISHHCKMMEVTCKGLMDLHKSLASSSQTFIINSKTAEQTTSTIKSGSVSHKTSPSIIITDTSSSTPASLSSCWTSASNVIGRIPAADTTDHISSTPSRSHVPTDEDMKKIIEFLSSTFMPPSSAAPPPSCAAPPPSSAAPPPSSATVTSEVTMSIRNNPCHPQKTPIDGSVRQQELLPTAMKHSGSNPELYWQLELRKQPLGPQRSSPLPGTSAKSADPPLTMASLSSASRHHSDWQIYASIQQQQQQPTFLSHNNMAAANPPQIGRGQPRGQRAQHHAQQQAQQQQLLQPPFSVWTSGNPMLAGSASAGSLIPDSIWSCDTSVVAAVSGTGDEALGCRNTDQLFSHTGLSLMTALPTASSQTRRSSYDSSVSSQSAYDVTSSVSYTETIDHVTGNESTSGSTQRQQIPTSSTAGHSTHQMSDSWPNSFVWSTDTENQLKSKHVGRRANPSIQYGAYQFDSIWTSHGIPVSTGTRSRTPPTLYNAAATLPAGTGVISPAVHSNYQ